MAAKKLIIVGAGPKAMAIAAKNQVLAEMGFSVPDIHIIERREVGANWTGNAGFTNGKLALGTSPEKDVGFPYQSVNWGEDLNEKIDRRMKDFSWQSYLIAQREYSDWVDRGRPAPAHRQWASYLQWVWEAVSDRTTCHLGEVSGLALEGDQWAVTYDGPGGAREVLHGDGLVVTGPGRIKLGHALPNHDRMLTVETFWKRYQQFRDLKNARIALIGTGENAAAIAMALAESSEAGVRVDILSPQGMAYSRGESFRENRVYSNPENGRWETLNEADRRNFIRRTDRGVFSQQAQRVLDSTSHIDVLPGRMREVTLGVGGSLVVTKEYDGQTEKLVYDYVVVATGADPLAFLRDLMKPSDEADVLRRAKIKGLDQEEVEATIDSSLAMAGLRPRLHLPMLSGVSQGPGFANLSCLGRLSDRILEAYVPRCNA